MYKKGSKGWLKHWDFLILDEICLHISLWIAFVMRHGFGLMYDDVRYRNLAAILLLLDFAVVVFFDSMKNVVKRGLYRELVMTVRHVGLVLLFLTGYLFITQEGEVYSRKIFVYLAIIYVIVGYVVRIMWRKVLLRRMANSKKRSIVIATVSELAEDVVSKVAVRNYEGFHVAGIAVLDEDMTGQKLGDVPVVADRASVVDYVCREWVDEVLVVYPENNPYPKKIVDKFVEMGVIVHVKIADKNDLLEQNQLIERIGDYTVITTSINYVTHGQLLMKRVLDIIGGLVGVIITGILVLIIGPMIKIQSPGPIFFKQERVGKNGKKFKMYKFRSMYMDAEERKKELMAENRVKDGMMFKLDFDPRIIGAKKLPDGTIKKGLGNYIRDLSLDEFPQFINVLKGDMSLVGTRPPTVDEWEKYELHHRARLAIKPGVTGMWQVSGRSNITDFEEVVRLDTKYITEWSLALDIKILFKTVAVVFKKEGSM